MALKEKEYKQIARACVYAIVDELMDRMEYCETTKQYTLPPNTIFSVDKSIFEAAKTEVEKSRK